MLISSGMLKNTTIQKMNDYSTLFNRAIEFKISSGKMQVKILPRFTRTGDRNE